MLEAFGRGVAIRRSCFCSVSFLGDSGLRATNKSSGAFRTISEVSRELNVPQHVLRFWESRFAHIRPMKRAGGRRYYRPEDIRLLVGIKNFLYDDGYTIKGVQKLLRTHGPRLLVGRSEGRSLAEMDKQGQLFRDERTGGRIGDDSRSVLNRKVIQEIVSELEELRDLLDKAL